MREQIPGEMSMSLFKNSIPRQASGLSATAATRIILLLVLIVSLLPRNILSQNSSHAASGPSTELIWSFETGG